jgi:hypothetical protein
MAIVPIRVVLLFFGSGKQAFQSRTILPGQIGIVTAEGFVSHCGSCMAQGFLPPGPGVRILKGPQAWDPQSYQEPVQEILFQRGRLEQGKGLKGPEKFFWIRVLKGFS